MHDSFQRLLTLSGPEVQALNAQAQLGEVLPPRRSQFAHLVRHFLARFFNHETASPDGDAKTRLVQIAFAAGLPPFLVAVYLWPVYHPFPGWPPGSARVGPPQYWVQANHHFFFVVYSFAVVGIATVFEWDLFFPDLTDLFVLSTLPIPARRLFAARVAAIALLVSAFLVDTCCLAPVVLPLATDPPSLLRFLAAHVTAVLAAGLFSAAMVLALQSLVLALFGERMFRRVALFAQGTAVTAYTLLLLFFPVLSGVTPQILQSGNRSVLLFPPFWFLGIYQRILDGPAAKPVLSALASCGVVATLAAGLLVVAAYPVAYVRRLHQLLQGTPLRSTRNRFACVIQVPLHMAAARTPAARAVFHFIGQTLLRVPRYRIYLVLYGGVGLASVVATVFRLHVTRQGVGLSIDDIGFRMVIGLIAFWTIAGLRTSFVSAGNRQGAWIWRSISGDPPPLRVKLQTASAAQRWAMICGLSVTFAALSLLRIDAPPELKTTLSTAAQFTLAAGCCVLLTDFLFLRCDTIPFTGTVNGAQDNLALTVLGYFTLLPLVMACSIACEQWMEPDIRNIGIAAVLMLVAHLWLCRLNRDHLRICSEQPSADEDDELFVTTLRLHQ